MFKFHFILNLFTIRLLLTCSSREYNFLAEKEPSKVWPIEPSFDQLPPLLRHENRGDLHLIGAVAIGIARIFGVTCGGAATRVSRYPSFHAFHDEERPQACASKLFAKMPHSREFLLHNEVMNVGKGTLLPAFREGCKRAKFGEIRRNSVRISS